MVRFVEELLPKLQAWNEGKGVSAFDYLYSTATSEVALGYCALFWPDFVEFEGYILMWGFAVDNLRSWEQSATATKTQIEAAMNYVGIGDLFLREEEDGLVRARIEHLGHVLRESYTAKLARDFPERAFKVEIIDDEDEYALTFFQA